MTNEEAIKEFEYVLDNRTELYAGYDDVRDALSLAINALEKQSRYAWHDLRKNPEDLPKTFGEYDICVAVKFNNGVIVYEAYRDYDLPKDGKYHKIIAWRYIEPFEEVE